MRRLAAAGDRAGALAAGERLPSGCAPSSASRISPQTRALRRSCAGRSPRRPPRASNSPGSSAATPSSATLRGGLGARGRRRGRRRGARGRGRHRQDAPGGRAARPRRRGGRADGGAARRWSSAARRRSVCGPSCCATSRRRCRRAAARRTGPRSWPRSCRRCPPASGAPASALPPPADPELQRARLSRRPSTRSSTPRPTGRWPCCSRTSTWPTARASSCSPTSPAGSPRLPVVIVVTRRHAPAQPALDAFLVAQRARDARRRGRARAAPARGDRRPGAPGRGARSPTRTTRSSRPPTATRCSRVESRARRRPRARGPAAEPACRRPRRRRARCRPRRATSRSWPPWPGASSAAASWLRSRLRETVVARDGQRPVRCRPTVASASVTRCCARPSSPSCRTRVRASCTRSSPASSTAAPPRSRATCGSPASTTRRRAGCSTAAREAVAVGAVEDAAAYLEEAIEPRAGRPRAAPRRWPRCTRGAGAARTQSGLLQEAAGARRRRGRARARARRARRSGTRGALCWPRAHAGAGARGGATCSTGCRTPDPVLLSRALALQAWGESNVGNLEVADELLARLDALASDDPTVRHEIDNARGFRLLRAGDIEGALAAFLRDGPGRRSGPRPRLHRVGERRLPRQRARAPRAGARLRRARARRRPRRCRRSSSTLQAIRAPRCSRGWAATTRPAPRSPRSVEPAERCGAPRAGRPRRARRGHGRHERRRERRAPSSCSSARSRRGAAGEPAARHGSPARRRSPGSGAPTRPRRSCAPSRSSRSRRPTARRCSSRGMTHVQGARRARARRPRARRAGGCEEAAAAWRRIASPSSARRAASATSSTSAARRAGIVEPAQRARARRELELADLAKRSAHADVR